MTVEKPVGMQNKSRGEKLGNGKQTGKYYYRSLWPRERSTQQVMANMDLETWREQINVMLLARGVVEEGKLAAVTHV